MDPSLREAAPKATIAERTRQTSNHHQIGPTDASGEPDFIEIFVDTPIEICEQRDPKGLYKKVRAGEIKGFTGIDDPYEAPANPELRLDGGAKSADTLADEVIAHLEKVGVIPVLTRSGSH